MLSLQSSDILQPLTVDLRMPLRGTRGVMTVFINFMNGRPASRYGNLPSKERSALVNMRSSLILVNGCAYLPNEHRQQNTAMQPVGSQLQLMAKDDLKTRGNQ